MESDLPRLANDARATCGQATMNHQQKFSAGEEIVIPSGRANRFAFLLFFLAAVLFGVPFALIWSASDLVLGFKNFFSNFLLLVPSLIGGMLIHELIHAVAFSTLSGLGFSSIQFGINWRQLAPYIHVRKALLVKHYRLGIMLPMILTGILPALLSLIIGNGWLMCFSIIFIAGGAGDVLAWTALRRFSANHFVLDHPDHLGFTIMTP